MVGVALTVALAAGVVAIGVHLGAGLLVHHRGQMTAAERLKAENDARTSLVQLIAGIGLVGGLIFTVRTFGLTKHTQHTDRFSKALDQIGNKDSEAVRVGGTYALWLLADEADEFWAPVEEVLSAVVRMRAAPRAPLAGDTQAALTILGRRPKRDDGHRSTPVDLRGVDIQRADLTNANLERVRLDGAILDHARLIDASMVRARLTGGHLNFADLKSADLTNATLTGAMFREAEMFETILAGAEITDCDFTDAKNLTAEQLALAEGIPAALP